MKNTINKNQKGRSLKEVKFGRKIKKVCRENTTHE